MYLNGLKVCLTFKIIFIRIKCNEKYWAWGATISSESPSTKRQDLINFTCIDERPNRHPICRSQDNFCLPRKRPVRGVDRHATGGGIQIGVEILAIQRNGEDPPAVWTRRPIVLEIERDVVAGRREIPRRPLDTQLLSSACCDCVFEWLRRWEVPKVWRSYAGPACDCRVMVLKWLPQPVELVIWITRFICLHIYIFAIRILTSFCVLGPFFFFFFLTFYIFCSTAKQKTEYIKAREQF